MRHHATQTFDIPYAPGMPNTVTFGHPGVAISVLAAVEVAR